MWKKTVITFFLMISFIIFNLKKKNSLSEESYLDFLKRIVE
jgi:hypothetical protein